MTTARGILRPVSTALAVAVITAAASAQSLAPRTDGNVSVREVAVSATVEGRVARVTLEEVVANAGGRDAEAILLLPLPDGAAVDGLSLWIDGKETGGELLDARRARGVYESIVRKRKDPALLECAGGRLYRVRVYPVPPRGERRVKISWSELLPGDAGSVTWTFPLRLPARSGAVPARVSLVVEVAAGRPLSAVWSPSHRAEVTRSDDLHARVAWETAGPLPDRDFVLILQEPSDELGFTLVPSRPAGEKEGSFLMVLSPGVAADERPLPRDVVLCLDTSGSMSGEKVEQARAAMKHAVRTLGPEDRFALLAFATALRSFRAGLVPAEPATVEAALGWIDGLSASGGTAIEEALLESVGRFRSDGEGRRGVLLFLTDGLPTVGETDGARILAHVRAGTPPRARAFVFGVGHDVNTWLLDSVARSLRGARDYVVPGEDIERKVSALVDKTRYPALTDLSLEVEGVEVHDLQPRHLPDLFRGSELVVAGRYSGSGEALVRVRARDRDGERVFERPASFPERADGAAFVDRLWAVRRVGWLMDEIRLNGGSAELKDEIVALARRHGIVTPYTARLVLEPGMDVPMDEANLGDPRFRSDAPFEGAGNNADIGVGGGSGGRSGGRVFGHRNLKLEGGAGTEGATESCLEWLKGRQDSREAWGDAGTTGLTLLPFLGYGETHKTPRYGRIVRAGLKYLKQRQDADGCFGPRTGPSWLLGHAYAALAMNEAYGLTRSPLFKAPAQNGTDFLLASRNPDGGWGSGGEATGSEVVTTAWVVMALRAAAGGGLRVDVSLLDGALRWLEEADAAEDRGTALAALCARVVGGARVEEPAVRDALAVALGPPPASARGETWFFGTLAAYRIGGEEWKAWNASMKKAIIDSQRMEKGTATWGSWDPPDPSDDAARLRVTVFHSLCLQVYYRYGRAIGIGSTASRPLPPGAPVSPDPTGGDAVRRSLEAKRLAEAKGTEAGGGPAAVEGAEREVAGRTFTFRGGLWRDGSVDPAAPCTTVAAYSEEWFALSRSSPEAGRWLALGAVVVEIGGRVIEVQEVEGR